MLRELITPRIAGLDVPLVSGRRGNLARLPCRSLGGNAITDAIRNLSELRLQVTRLVKDVQVLEIRVIVASRIAVVGIRVLECGRTPRANEIRRRACDTERSLERMVGHVPIDALALAQLVERRTEELLGKVVDVVVGGSPADVVHGFQSYIEEDGRGSRHLAVVALGLTAETLVDLGHSDVVREDTLRDGGDHVRGLGRRRARAHGARRVADNRADGGRVEVRHASAQDAQQNGDENTNESQQVGLQSTSVRGTHTRIPSNEQVLNTKTAVRHTIA